MLKARKSILAMLIALTVFASFGFAFAGEIDGLMTNNGTAIPDTLNVNVNPGGLGDTLLYPYYNADGMITYFTVVNTSETTAIRARVRFREAATIAGNAVFEAKVPTCDKDTEPQGSIEVLDFDMCLSKGDMFIGYIKKNASTGGGELCTFDADTLLADGVNVGLIGDADMFTGDTCAQFKFGSDNPLAADASGAPLITAAMTLEGHFEIIGEDSVATEHSAADCGAETTSGLDVPNTLMGQVAIANTANGAMYTYNATALADFNSVGFHFRANSASPDLTDAADGLAGVNYVLTKATVASIYDLAGGQTEILLTFPSKLNTAEFYGCPNIFTDTRVLYGIWDDAENQPGTSGCHGSPCGKGGDDSIDNEVNIIAVKNNAVTSNFITTQVGTTVDVKSFVQGWLSIDFRQSNNATINDSASVAGVDPTGLDPYHVTAIDDSVEQHLSWGWPALGFTMINIDDKGVSTGSFPLAYTTDTEIRALP